MISIIVLLLLLYITKGFFIIALGLSFLCLACPLVIRSSSKTILAEKDKVDTQALHDIPACFDKKKVLISYVKIFVLLCIFPAIGFVLPGGLWILVLPPLSVISFAVLKLTEHTWASLGWKKRSYWLLSGMIASIIFLAVLLYRYGMGISLAL